MLQSCAADKDTGSVQDKKEQVEVSRKARYFSQVDISALCDVHFIQGDRPSVRIVGDRRDVENIITVYNGEELSIRSKSMRDSFLFSEKREAVQVYITSPDLIRVSMRGAGDFEVSGKLDTDTIDIRLKGAGNVHLPDVICDRIAVSLNGVGEVDLDKVQCDVASLSLRGAGEIDANLFKVGHTDINLLGTGEMDIHFNDCLSAVCELKGIGEIELKGSVKTLRKTRKGTGSIDTDGLTAGKIVSE